MASRPPQAPLPHPHPHHYHHHASSSSSSSPPPSASPPPDIRPAPPAFSAPGAARHFPPPPPFPPSGSALPAASSLPSGSSSWLRENEPPVSNGDRPRAHDWSDLPRQLSNIDIHRDGGTSRLDSGSVDGNPGDISWQNLNGVPHESRSEDGSMKGPSASLMPELRPFAAPPNEPLPPSFMSVSHLPTPPAPPTFHSPFRPAVPSINTLPSPLIGSAPFSEIPFVSPVGSQNRSQLDPNWIEADDRIQSALAGDDYETSNGSTASSFVLFTSHLVPREKKVFNATSLGFGALVCPGRELVPGPPTVRRPAFRCHNCGAYANLYCSIVPGTGQWKCPLCKRMNDSEGEYRAASKEDLQNCPELVTTVVDHVEAGNRRLGFVPVSDTTMAAPVVVLIDESVDEPHLQHLQSSLHAFLNSLPPTTRIGLVSFGKTVSVYDFSESGVAAADVFPGKVSPIKELLKMLVYGTGVYLAPLHVCLGLAQTVVSSLRPYRGDLPEAARDRCLGTAVEIALALIQGPSTEMPRSMVKRSGGNSRIIICLGGPNTSGTGSVPHSQSHPNYAYIEKKAIKQMEHLGNEARRQDAVVDIFCAGTCPVRIPVLQPLSTASGGVLVLNDDFGETFGLNLQRAVKRATGFRGILEARFSDGISVTRMIGPVETAVSDTHESFKNDKSVAVQMLSIEECQSVGLMVELREDIKEENVYFQFAVRYTNVHQMNVTRVITVRLPVTNSSTAYLESVDDEVAAVFIGKRTALLAKNASDTIDMQASVDERVKDMALKFGKPMNNTKLRRFPRELLRLPEILFHLRRGPLLGSIVGHEDERMVLRNLFLHASFDMSLRMLSPRVLMHRDGGTFEELPAYDLAMQSDAALVLDHGTDVFIWMGSDLAADEGRSAAALAACRTLAEELTEQRFPAPRTLAFKEGSSQARYLQARLIPAHKDPPYEQEARFPQLRTLNPEQRAKLKSRFFHVDDLSFFEWMRSLKLIPPEVQ